MMSTSIVCIHRKRRLMIKIFISNFSILLLTIFSLHVLAEQESTNDEGYETALNEYTQGNVDEALIHVKNALKTRQDNLSARLLFAKILLEKGELAAAEDQYDRALALKADPALVLLPYANVLLLQSKYQALIDNVKVGNYTQEINVGIYNYRGNAFAQLLDKKSAEQHFNQAYQLDNTSLNAIIGLAGIANSKDNKTEFEHYLTLAKTIAPDNSQVWFYQGEYFRSIKQPENAIKAYDKAIALNENNVEARRSRAVINLDLTEYDAAIKDIDTILEKTPDDPFTLLVKAFYLKRINEEKQAEDILQSTSYLFSQIDLEKFDQFAPLLFIDGMTHYLLGNKLEAKKSLKQYLKKSPSSTEAKEILAEIALSENIPKKSIDLLSDVKPANYSLRSVFILMSAHIQNEAYDQSAKIYQNSPDELKNNGKLISLYTMSLIALGEGKSAIALIEKTARNQPNSKDIQLMLGYHYLQFQHYDKALSVALKLIENKSLSLPELNYIAVVYQNNKQIEEAIEYYKKALELAPLDLLTSINLIQLLIEEKSLTQANTLTTEYLAEYPNESRILKLHAKALLALGKNKEAIAAYQQLNKNSADDLAIKYQLVNLYLKDKQPDSALKEIRIIKKLEPLASASLIAEAKAYLIKNEYEKAAKPLNIAFGLNLESAERLEKIADLQIQAKDWVYLERSITRIMKLSGYTEQVTILKSRALFAQGKVTSAITLLEKSNKQTHLSYYYLAHFYANLKKVEQAQKHGEHSFKLTPNNAALQLLIRLYWKNNQQEKAIELLTSWLKNNEYDNTTRKVYANLLSQLNQNNNAISQYKIILEQAPDDVFSLNNLSVLLTNKTLYKQAEVLAKKAVALKPLDATVNDTLGWSLVLQDKPSEGLTYLRESSARDSNNPTTKYHIAVALADLGKIEEAKMELLQIVDKEFKQQALAKEKLNALN